MKTMLAIVLALSALSAPAIATEQDQLQAMSGNATAYCHTALPSFDNPIRFRPLAVANEGSTNAYVTCSLISPTNSDGTEWFGVILKNTVSNQGSAQVTCTGVAGVDNGLAQYIAKTITIAPLGRSNITWHRDPDNGGDRWQTNVSLSCLLPPGVAINEVFHAYRQR